MTESCENCGCAYACLHCDNDIADDLRRENERLRAMTELDKCQRCGGPADNGHDREHPPNPYVCTRCSALLDAYRAGQEEMLERADRAAVDAYYDCPAEKDVDAFISEAIRALPIYNGQGGSDDE